MTTLAQALQRAPDLDPGPRTVDVQSATAATVQTGMGPVVNATGTTPTSGGEVVVLTIRGTPYAIGWIRP